MEACGLRPHDVRALILTHEHGDHTGGIAVWHRAFPVELFASEGSTELRRALRELPFNHFAPGETLELAGMRVDTSRLPTTSQIRSGFASRATATP